MRRDLDLAGRGSQGDLALVVAVDADDPPAGQDSRAAVGLLDLVEQVAEERDRVDPDIVAVLQRPGERAQLTVDIGEDSDPASDLA